MTDTVRESSSGKGEVGRCQCGFPWGEDPVRHATFCDDRRQVALSTPDRARVEVLEEAARMCERLGGMLPEEGARDELGWPMTPLGAARHQSFALADAIRALAHTTAVSGE
jgi:hypothetical protein